MEIRGTFSCEVKALTCSIYRLNYSSAEAKMVVAFSSCAAEQEQIDT